MDRPRGLRKTRDSNAPMKRFNPTCDTILSHHLEISSCCAVFLFVVLISLMDLNVLRECAQRLVLRQILSETQTELPNKLLT